MCSSDLEQEVYADEGLEVPEEYTELPEEDTGLPEEDTESTEDEVYNEIDEVVPDDPVTETPPEADSVIEEASIEPEQASQSIPAPVPVEPREIGTELPVGHDEHKQCPGCGIYVDLEDVICPVCDTEFAAIGESIPDSEIEILSEEEELANLGVDVDEEDAELAVEEPLPVDSLEPEKPIEAAVPESSSDEVGATTRIECPSCGADLDAGTATCPVCEYPIE